MRRGAAAQVGRRRRSRRLRPPGISGSWLDASNPDYRQILEQFGFYNRALASNLPFPKTRRIVFPNNKPATLPGWAELGVEG